METRASDAGDDNVTTMSCRRHQPLVSCDIPDSRGEGGKFVCMRLSLYHYTRRPYLWIAREISGPLTKKFAHFGPLLPWLPNDVFICFQHLAFLSVGPISRPISWRTGYFRFVTVVNCTRDFSTLQGCHVVPRGVLLGTAPTDSPVGRPRVFVLSCLGLAN